jgi:uncharacterized alpha-E superfamily protein
VHPPDDHHPEPDLAEESAMIESRTVLLSRVAEHLYWAGRYLERAEATARMVRTHTELFVDLPKRVGLRWEPLLAITGSIESFHQDHETASEDAVVGFLLADAAHQGSVVSSMAAVRENLRVTRGLIPRRLWEVVNESHRWIGATARGGVRREARLMWTEEVIRRCHTVSGSVTSTMSRDQAYAVLEIGRLVERADMTSRVLDVAGFTLDEMTDDRAPYAHLAWMSMLRTLGGEQMYRRQLGGVITAPRAIRFLLHDASFPRSIEYCLIEISRWLLELPRQQEPMAASVEVQTLLDTFDTDHLETTHVHDFVDRVQRGIGGLHDHIATTYFSSAELATA